ncbi:MAG: aldo/keto reductase [Gemmatimonadaceae bacterium]|jgi:aryl-alcohol dehydrogenase-like predicted oxidoreductase|nr:aldo/keto reductase [Gemmatimonadaceae bacterium]
MRYHLLGRSGLRVSDLCLGTMTFGDDWGWGAAREESMRQFDLFAAAGGNFIDTANGYTNGSSERLIGEFVAGDRDRWVIATKYTASMRPGDPNAGGNQRKSLLQNLHGSLERLGTDHVDLLWVHAWDFRTPIDEMMRALDDVVRQGKVLHVGISDAPAWVVSRANTMAELRGWSPFIGLQVEYSLVERTPERDLLPMARGLDLGVTAWSPLGGGVLSGKYNAPAAAGDARRLDNAMMATLTAPSERNLRIAAAVGRVAGEIGASAPAVALAWLRSRPQVIPIIGARTSAQLEANLASASLVLDAAHVAALDAVSAIELGFPHDFLKKELPLATFHGGTWDQVDDHRAGRAV